MEVTCLVFASKRVGEQLFSYLLETEYPPDRIVVGSEGDRAILNIAEKAGIPAEVISPDVLQNLVETGRTFDWLLSLWCPTILPASVLNLAQRRLNTHPGLVPACRGNDTAAWTIRKNLPAGVCLMEMDESVDTGDVYVQREIAWEFPTRGQELFERLQEEVVDLFKTSWPAISRGEIQPTPQAKGGCTHTRKETNEDRVRSGTDAMSAGNLLSWALAHDFFPDWTAEVEREGRRYKVRVIVDEAETGF
jgi:methionyl-tRNA formyltransferase